jgi:hypothetical protein
LRRGLVVFVVIGALACAPEPVYDDDIGVQAEPADVGAHAGTFALKTINATEVDVPIDGLSEDPLGGGVNYRLVTRAWDEASETYLQRSTLCGGYNFEVLGVLTSVADVAFRRVPESTAEIVTLDHERGLYESTGHVQLWAIELDDPFNDPFPATPEEGLADERIFDLEPDDKPGLTLFVEGLIEGEVYAAQRKRVDLEGVIQGPDYAVGLANNRAESVTLGNNNDVLDASEQGGAVPYPDPKESWFEEVRIADDSDCDDVMSAEADGVLSRLRPF